mmetsp:Transcript_17094/g.43043  ORF Transcript_17094/g.43043 Transcript_17094/m.43043 type:complete len:309 (+) Transcript_17094:340-1266(+)
MHTVALPATGLAAPLYFTAATAGSTAASNWIGPSMNSCGASLRASSVALRTLSIIGPWLESPEAYDSIATRGVTPKARAVCALATAISASCSAVGSTLIAQSPYTYTLSRSSMKKTELTSEKPGAVLMSCSAGRIVFAVLWHAPLTIPSAFPCSIIIVPKYAGSERSSSRAASSVIPVFLRASHSPRTISSPHEVCSSLRTVSGWMMAAPSMETCACSARARTAFGSPSSVTSHSPRVSRSAAAVTMRRSSPSGSTMRCLLFLAAVNMLCFRTIGERSSAGGMSPTIASRKSASRCFSMIASETSHLA